VKRAADVGSGSAASSSSTALVLQETGLHCLQPAAAKPKAVSKLLQSESLFGLLVRGRDSQLHSVIGTTSTWIQLLDRTTAECVAEADRRRSALTPAADKFRFQTRLVSVDADGSNLRAERALLRKKSGLVIGCRCC